MRRGRPWLLVMVAVFVAACGDDGAPPSDAGDDDAGGDAGDPCATEFYRDRDGDEFGDTVVVMRACALPEGFAAVGGDCDDTCRDCHPGAVEICDGLDNDCDADHARDESFDCVMGEMVGCATSCGSTGTGLCSTACTAAPVAECAPPEESCSFTDDDCDGLIDEGVREPLSLRTVRDPESHGMRLQAGAGDELLAVYHEVGNLYVQRLAADGTNAADRVLAANGVIDYDVVTGPAGVVVIWLNGGRIYGRVLSATDLSEVTPETLIHNPGAATDRVRLHVSDAGTAIVAYEIGGTLSAFAVPLPALRDMAPIPRIVSTDVSRRFAITSRGPAAYVFYTRDSTGQLFGVRLTETGARDGTSVALTTPAAGAIDRDPAVAVVDDAGEARLGLVWGHSEPGDDRLRFAVLAADLSMAAGPVDLPGMTDDILNVLDPPGVDTPTGVVVAGGRFLVTAQIIQALDSQWYAHEVIDEGATLVPSIILPEPCGARPCNEVYTSATIGANGTRVLIGSTRDGDDSARVTPFGCP